MKEMVPGEAITPGDGVDVVTPKKLKMMLKKMLKTLKMVKTLCCPMISTVLSVSPYSESMCPHALFCSGLLGN